MKISKSNEDDCTGLRLLKILSYTYEQKLEYLNGCSVQKPYKKLHFS